MSELSTITLPGNERTGQQPFDVGAEMHAEAAMRLISERRVADFISRMATMQVATTPVYAGKMVKGPKMIFESPWEMTGHVKLGDGWEVQPRVPALDEADRQPGLVLLTNGRGLEYLQVQAKPGSGEERGIPEFPYMVARRSLIQHGVEPVTLEEYPYVPDTFFGTDEGGAILDAALARAAQ